MDVRHLRTFAVLAEELHFGRAAHRLHTSQPVVSRTLRDMEDELGTRLVERSARKVELTRAGTSFLRSAREALRHFETAVRAAQTGVGDGLERLRLGVMIGASHPVVGRLVAAFRVANPSASVDVVSTDERRLGPMLAERRIDAAICWDECVPGGLSTLPIAREPLDVLLPEAHPLAAREAIAIEELAGEPLILPDRAHHPILYDRFRTQVAASGGDPDFAVNVEDLSQLLAMVAGGAAVGVAPVPEGLVYPGIARRPQSPEYAIGFDLVWSQMTAVVRTLTEAVGRLAPHKAQLSQTEVSA